MTLPVNINRLSRLEALNLAHCNALQTLPQLPNNLRNLSVTCRGIETFPALSICANLLELRLVDCFEVKEIHLGSLKLLRHLSFKKCEKLHRVEGIGESYSLEHLDMTNCKSIENLPNLSKLGKLKELFSIGCKKLKELQGLEELPSLHRIDISHSLLLYHYAEKWPHIPWKELPRSFSEIDLSKYKVFLSFRGQDIINYVDTNRGLSAFRDNGELAEGLVEAINQSKIVIPIFSKGHASSIRCLNKLTHIVECKKNRIESIFPFFYDAPDQVREQSGSYEEALKQHMKRHDANMVENWRAALEKVGSLKGWELQNLNDGDNEEFVMGVLPQVLAKQESYASVCIAGLKNHVKEFMKLLEIDASDVGMVVIYGTAGVGKTTLAKVLYNRFKEHFVYHSFLADIRETSLQHMGLVEVQSQQTTGKVLLVVDDVDHRDQFNALASYVHSGLLPPGSRIIITSKNEEALDMQYVRRTYELSGLQLSNALDLFHECAFGWSTPSPDFITVS